MTSITSINSIISLSRFFALLHALVPLLYFSSSSICLGFIIQSPQPSSSKPHWPVRPQPTFTLRGGDVLTLDKKAPSFLSSSNYGKDMNQHDMMESDMLITVDEHDNLVNAAGGQSTSKKSAHTFDADQPRGILHRAFSFFLFDSQNRMLLTRRASSKITFPGVWTNTCCSHPLYGMTPDEVDSVPDAYPNFPGIKHAAIRKCRHELGVLPEYIPHDKIVFLSRFHYWAADTVTYGKEPPWGEHEVDYILFFRLPEGIDLPVNPCDDEVEEYKYVTIDELKEMMKDPDLLWSPWFLGIMERGGFDWWEDIDNSLAGKNTNENVVFFDPPEEHRAAYNKDTHGRQTGVLSANEGVLQE